MLNKFFDELKENNISENVKKTRVIEKSKIDSVASLMANLKSQVQS